MTAEACIKKFPANFPSQDSEEESLNTFNSANEALEWSVSGISLVSGRNGQENFIHSEISSRDTSRPNSPADLNSSSKIKEMDNLIEAMQSLVSNSNGSKNSNHSSVKEEPSFRNLVAEETDDTFGGEEEEEDLTKIYRSPVTNYTGQNAVLNSTPPVKDPGLNPNSGQGDNTNRTSSQKLFHMRSLIQELETAHKKHSISKIPRRSLNFGPGNTNRSKNIRNESDVAISDELEKTAIEQELENSKKLNVKSTTSVVKSNVEKDEEESNELKKQIHNLENVILDLRQKTGRLEQDLKLSREIDGEKEMAIDELRSKMNILSKSWTESQEMKKRELLKSQEECQNTKNFLIQTKKDLSLCEYELEKAVNLAKNFKLKFEEEQKIRENSVNEFFKEKEKSDFKIRQLLEDLESKKRENQDISRKLREVDKECSEVKLAASNLKRVKEEYEIKMAKEKSDVQLQISQLGQKLNVLETQLAKEQANNKRSESNLHGFYQSQMEAILSEKVQLLQGHVTEMEENLLREREEAIDQLRQKHQQQSEELKISFASEIKEVIGKFVIQKEALEASLNAARQEADCLREQLRQMSRISLGENPPQKKDGSKSKNLFRAARFESAYLDDKQQQHRTLSPTTSVSSSSSSVSSNIAAGLEQRVPSLSSAIPFLNLRSNNSSAHVFPKPQPTMLNNKKKVLRSKSAPHYSNEVEEEENSNKRKKNSTAKQPKKLAPHDKNFSDTDVNNAILTKAEKEKIVRDFLLQLDENGDNSLFLKDETFKQRVKAMADNLIDQTTMRLNESSTEFGAFHSLENDLRSGKH